jgi:DNA processing protein
MERIGRDSTAYPEALKEIPEPPHELWLAGTFPPPGHTRLAVVGSRALSPYGKEVCESLIAGLAGYPISIISGLALGADGCAHRAAMRTGLHTLAVPGSGLAHAALYPRAHVGLAKEILESGGGLLSEHEPNYRARAYDFPSRNRIMVGLADAVLMVEAGERSGTLITARLAGEYNRQLLCIPHRIGDVHGYGSHFFLRFGATLVSEPEHILEALGIEPRESAAERNIDTLSPPERAIVSLLSEPRTRDELLRSCGLPAHEALAILGTLELAGILKETFGTWRRA